MSKMEHISGYLDGNGSSRHSARADHTHAGDGVTLKAVKKTIKANDWNNKAADVPFTEGTFVTFNPDAASAAAATTAALVLSTIGTNKVTFGCTTTPDAAIDVYILYV